MPERWTRTYPHDGKLVRIHFERRGDSIACDFRVSGRRIRLSTEESDREKAAVRAWELYIERLSTTPEQPRKSDRHLTIKSWAVWDLERAELERCNAAYQATLTHNWRNLIRHLGGDRLLIDLIPDDIDEYHAARKRERNKSGEQVRNQTIEKELTCLKRAVRKALAIRQTRAVARWRESLEHLLAAWPKPRSADPADPKRKGHVRPLDIVQAAYDLAGADLRDEILVAVRTGVRAEEIKGLLREWFVDRPLSPAVPGYLALPADGTKTKEDRIMPLPGPAYDVVRRRCESTSGGPFIFSQASHKTQLRNISDKLQLKYRLKPKDLRTTFGTLIAGDNLHDAQAALGHSDPRTTTRHYVDRQKEGAIRAAETVETALEKFGHKNLVTSQKKTRSGRVSKSRKLLKSKKKVLVRAEGIEPTTYGLRVQEKQAIPHSYGVQCCNLAHVISGTCDGARSQNWSQRDVLRLAAEIALAQCGALT